MSCDDFAPKNNRSGLRFPQGVLNVATFLDLSLSRSWWYPCLMPNLEKTVQSWNLYFVQDPLDYPVSFHVLVGYPEVYPGVYHMKFQIFFSCSTELRLWLSPYRWTLCHWFPFWHLIENPYFKTLLQPFVEWFLQVVSNWSGPVCNWYSLVSCRRQILIIFVVSDLVDAFKCVSELFIYPLEFGICFFFVLEWTLTSGISFWNSEAGEGLRVLCCHEWHFSDFANEGNCSLMLEIREPKWSHLSRQRFIFVYSLYATLIRLEHWPDIIGLEKLSW